MTEKERPNVLIIVPAHDHRVHTRLADWIQRIEETQHICDVSHIYIEGIVPHDAARNVGVQMARNADPKPTHVMFVDNDIIPPLGALNRLVLHKKPIVAAATLHVQYKEDGGRVYKMGWYKNDDGKFVLYEGCGLQKVDSVSAACLLVEMQVFNIIKVPFSFLYNKDGCVNASEEFVFSEKCTKAGFELWTDFDIECDHHRRASLLSLYKAGKDTNAK